MPSRWASRLTRLKDDVSSVLKEVRLYEACEEDCPCISYVRLTAWRELRCKNGWHGWLLLFRTARKIPVATGRPTAPSFPACRSCRFSLVPFSLPSTSEQRKGRLNILYRIDGKRIVLRIPSVPGPYSVY